MQSQIRQGFVRIKMQHLQLQKRKCQSRNHSIVNDRFDLQNPTDLQDRLSAPSCKALGKSQYMQCNAYTAMHTRALQADHCGHNTLQCMGLASELCKLSASQDGYLCLDAGNEGRRVQQSSFQAAMDHLVHAG